MKNSRVTFFKVRNRLTDNSFVKKDKQDLSVLISDELNHIFEVTSVEICVVTEL